MLTANLMKWIVFTAILVFQVCVFSLTVYKITNSEQSKNVQYTEIAIAILVLFGFITTTTYKTVTPSLANAVDNANIEDGDKNTGRGVITGINPDNVLDRYETALKQLGQSEDTINNQAKTIRKLEEQLVRSQIPADTGGEYRPEPTQEAKELAAQIEDDAGSYAQALKAIATGNPEQADELLDQAQQFLDNDNVPEQKDFAQTKIYITRMQNALYAGRGQEAMEYYKKIEKFDLWGVNLKTLPTWIAKLTKLKYLNLGSNLLTVLPEAIGELKNLQILFLNDNQLTALPEAIGKLANLQSLSLVGNQLTVLPEAIGKLANLQKLSLGFNQLTVLPKAIGKLANLQELNLEANQLTALPEAIGKLTNLQRLYLMDNQLTALPEAIGKLTNLQGLNLGNNNFSEEEKRRIKDSLPTGCKVIF